MGPLPDHPNSVSTTASVVSLLFLAASPLFSIPLFNAFSYLSSPVHSVGPEEESFSLIVHQLYLIAFQIHIDTKLIYTELFQILQRAS